MKTLFITLLLVLTPLAGDFFSQVQAQGLFKKVDNRLEWHGEGEVFWIEPFGQNTLRFRSSRSLHISDENWNILSQPEVKANIQILDGKAIIRNGNIRAEINEGSGLITYFNQLIVWI